MGKKEYVQVCMDPESFENVKRQIGELTQSLEKANALIKALAACGEISLPIRFGTDIE